MTNEKKIEDLIHSISSLINEAKEENKLLEQIENRIVHYDSNKKNLIDHKIIKAPLTNKKENLEKIKSEFYDWKTIKFLKQNIKNEDKIELEKKISKIFNSEIDLWMKINLKNIIQTELNNFSSKIISEKLK